MSLCPTRTAAGVTWLQGDYLGSASLATNAAGAKVSDQRYLPYGATRSGGVPTAYQFTGQRLDTGTGLYYYGARYYDAALGRFISADTVVPGAGSPQALNRYAYVYNNPLRYTDPSGHCALVDEGADGLCVRSTEDGGLQVVQGGSTFANDVEVGLANYFLSGNGSALNGIPVDTPGFFMRQSLQHVAAGLGYAQGGPDWSTSLADPMLVAAMAIGITKPGTGGNWLDSVPAAYQASVAQSYAGSPSLKTWGDARVIFRHWGGTAKESGSHWYSPSPYVRPGNARRFLALPSGNTAQNVSAFLVPAGTPVVTGIAAGKAADPLFGSYAKGGGAQIYVPDPSRLIFLGPVDVTAR